MVWLFGSSGVACSASGLFNLCRKGGSRSPQCRPLSVDQSIPHWLKPTRLSFWPATRLLGSAGLYTIFSSACRRYVQSWFTRTLPLEVRSLQPIVFLVCPATADSAFTFSSAFSWLLLSAPRRSPAAAAMSGPVEKNGSVLVTGAALGAG